MRGEQACLVERNSNELWVVHLYSAKGIYLEQHVKFVRCVKTLVFGAVGNRDQIQDRIGLCDRCILAKESMKRYTRRKHVLAIS